MQSSQTIIPFNKSSKPKHNDAHNPQGRCWKYKKRIRNGEIVKVNASHQSYPVKFFDDGFGGEPTVVKCRVA